MSIIYKKDEHDEEAIELLFAIINKKTQEYEDYYVHYSIDWEDSLPEGISADDIMLDHIQINSHTVGIFDRFIIFKRNIIECDLDKGDIYVYKLGSYDADSLNEVFDKIADCFRAASDVGLYNHWDASQSLTMNTLLHKSLLTFEEYHDVTLEEVGDILDWIGYNRVNKELH